MPITRVYDTKTWLAVIEFQKVAFPRFMEEWDGRVGRKTIAEMDNWLYRPRPLIMDPPETKGILVFIGGWTDEQHGGGGEDISMQSIGDVGYLMFGPMKSMQDPPKRIFEGYSGSLTNERGPNLAIDFITRNYNPRCKLVMYGFSAGGKQVLDLRRKIEHRNTVRPDEGNSLIKVDVLVTVDAAARKVTLGVNREVAGCVVLNRNYYQQVQGNLSNGAPNSVQTSAVTGRTPIRQPIDMTATMRAINIHAHREIEKASLSFAWADIRAALG